MKIKTNLCSGVIMGAVSILLLILLPSQVRIPAYDSGAPSPRIIPTIMLVGILVCSVFLIIQSLVLKKEKIYEFDIKNELPTIILIGMMLVFTFLVINLGFLVGVAALFPAMLFYMGERKPIVYILMLAAGVGIYFLFTMVFNISLPKIPGLGV